MKKGGFILMFLICISIFSQEKQFSFTTVEQIPVYEDCETFTTNVTRRKCMNTILNKHIQREFNFKIVDCLEKKTIYNRKKGAKKKCKSILLPGEKRIFLNFVIDTHGEIVNIDAIAPHSKLKKEIIRVANLIPKITTPGKEKGEYVRVSHALPIDFVVK